MKTLDGVIEALEGIVGNQTDGDLESEGYYLAKDSLYYLKAYQSDLQKKCRNCQYWHGRGAVDYSEDEEYYCEYETWTFEDDSCSRWVEME